ncbi:Hypothetical protein R9X50_00641600 [Acrodontium crateriforme]|uniref:Mis12 domain-containing protein n=1 Tax=Acrodontium crateriforme TaxID=150365 RepID=A0AAQ3MBI3_9PEZI|nr:Hypothetical protein R9X50_00641600 [Acrodontium crateriforme]
MTDSIQAQTALLTEHFRYTPLTLLDDIINTVNELIFRGVNAVEEGLSNAPAAALGFTLPAATKALTSPHKHHDALEDVKTNEIEHGIVQLESLLNATVDKDFDKFEIYTLRNILAVGHEDEGLAKWVRLEHYRNLDMDGAQTSPGPDAVQMQRRKLRETRKLNLMLKEEEARNAAVLKQLNSLVAAQNEGRKSEGEGTQQTSPFAFLTRSEHVSRTSTSQPLTNNVKYALSQLPALRQLLAELKESVLTLPNARHAREDENSAAAKRRRYLDSQARQAMERRGVTVDEAGKMAAGVAGRRIGREEVEGLEAVVQALGGGADSEIRDARDQR